MQELRTRMPSHTALTDAAVSGAARTVGGVAYLPMAGRKSFWTVVLDPVTAEVLALIPLDPY